MTTTNPTENMSAFHAKSLQDAIEENRRWAVMLEGNFLFRHHKGENGHAQRADTFRAVLIAAADHVESTASTQRDEESISYIADLCCSSRFWACVFNDNVQHFTTSRALNKEQFRMSMIELLSSLNMQARLLLLELRDLEAAAKRRKKTRSAVVLPFQPRSVRGV